MSAGKVILAFLYARLDIRDGPTVDRLMLVERGSQSSLYPLVPLESSPMWPKYSSELSVVHNFIDIPIVGVTNPVADETLLGIRRVRCKV